MILNSPTISGSLTVTGNIIASGSITLSGSVASASYASNAELLDGLDSTVFTLTSSFAAQTASFTAFTASILSYTSSQNILNGKYATTGSNTFTGVQTVNSNLVVTGSITAQTLVVQTITSSVDFVTGSTRFGSLLANTHVFSGSVTMNPGGLFVSSSGTVGIGTTTPSNKLTISNNGDAVVAFRINDTNANASFLSFNASNTDSAILAGGTSAIPFDIYTSGSVRMRITSTGTVGIGVTPSVWYSSNGYVALQVGNASLFGRNSTNSELYLSANSFDNASGNATYITSTFATRYNQNVGEHRWYSAPSGTAGNTFSFTERMKISADGNFDYGGLAVLSSNNPTYRQAFYGGLSIMWRGAEDCYINSNHTYGSSNTNVASYSTANGIGRLAIIGGNLEWYTNTGSVSAGVAYSMGIRFNITKNGNIGMPTTYGFTTSNAANLYIDSGDGYLYRSTSSSKYKTDIRDYDKGLAKVMQMRPVYYKGIGEHDKNKQFAGLIAEEVHDLGLTEFVQYADDETPDALAYSHMVALLTKAIQELKSQNDALQSRIETLESK